MTVEGMVTTHVMGLDRDREDAWPLALPAATIRLRDLIRTKVTHEVSEYLAGRRRMVGKEYLMLDELAAIQAAAARGQAMRLVAEDEVRKAWKAFEEGEYMVALGPREVHDLDAMVNLEPGARIQFLRLLPVAGGAAEGHLTRKGMAMGAREELLNEIHELALENDMNYFG